ncbi:MAG: DeoR/GlpR family DNA-binding transcription regulator [Christensenellales bacterium]|jgi:DeoR/GlpR family transcriptional regulator of sugar metabolism
MSQSIRFEQILALLETEKYLSIDELCRKLYVSPSTLRRDLTIMSRRGYLIRTHGGAKALMPDDAEDSIIHYHDITFTKAQNDIAARAAKIVCDGDVMFMDASRLTLCMSQYLRRKKQLTIVTNSLQLIQMMEGKHTLICCSGALSAQNLSVIDQTTPEIALSHNYHSAFFGCATVDSEYVMTRTPETAALLSGVISRAQKSYLLCTQDKIGQRASINAFPIRHLEAVLTDGEFPFLSEKKKRPDAQTI